MKKTSKIFLILLMIVSTYVSSGDIIQATSTSWISNIEITNENGSMSQEYTTNDILNVQVYVNFSEYLQKDSMQIVFPNEVSILQDEVFSIENTNHEILGTLETSKQNNSVKLVLAENVSEDMSLQGTFSITVRLNTDNLTNTGETALVFTDESNNQFTNTINIHEESVGLTLKEPRFSGNGAQEVSDKFKIDSLTLSMSGYLGGAKTTIYEEVNGVSNTTIPPLELDSYGAPVFHFDINWSQVNTSESGFEVGDYMKFDVVELQGDDTVINNMAFSPKSLYGDDGKKLATGHIEKVKISDGVYKLVYIVTFDPDPSVDLENLNKIEGEMDGYAAITGSNTGDHIIINKDGETIADIERVEKPSGSTPDVEIDKPKPSSKALKIYDDTSKTLTWTVNISEYHETKFLNTAPYTYDPLIFEEYVDQHQTFLVYPEATWRNIGVSCQFGIPVYLYNNAEGSMFQATAALKYLELDSTNPVQNGGMAYHAPAGNTATDMATAEAYVRANGKTWTVITEDDGSGNQRERMIVNFGAPKTGDYLKFSDFYSLTDLENQIIEIKDAVDTLINDPANSGATESTVLIDENGLKMTLKEWKELSQACSDSIDYYRSDPPIFEFMGTIRTKVKVEQPETGIAEKVTNGFRLSGGWTTQEYTAEANNGWSGTISGKPTKGDAVIYKADTLYGNTDNKTDDTPINGYIENVSFEVYKTSDPSTPLKFKYENGKYVYNASGSLTSLTTEGGTGSFVINGLTPESYFLKEVTSPSGFYSGQNEKIDFTVENDKITYKLINNDPRSVKLKKVDSDSGDALSGATFKLYKYSSSDYSDKQEVTGFTKTTINGESWYVYDGSSDAVLTVDNATATKGQLQITHLEAGKYFFEEVTAPNGYLVSNQKYEFELADTIPSDGITTIDIGNVENTLDVGDVKLTKVDKLTNGKLQGAEFSLFKEDNTLVSSGLTTDINGEITYTDLAPGKYYFQETKAPTGYVLDTTKLEFEILSNQTAIVSVTKDNTQKPGNVKLIKKADITNQVLAGAIFSLYKEDNH
ncbi:MAG: collagen binding domain-containing protein [Coprobacillaceae bacterium]